MTRKGNDGTSKPWRVFCAIELAADVRSRIQNHIERLREKVPACKASWSRVENIHLTVMFFGNVEPHRIASIASSAARAVNKFSAFEILIAGAGAFPKPNQPRVLWIGVDDQTGKLLELQQQFEEECMVEGFQKEDRAFRPHLTIARFRKLEGASAAAEVHQKLGFEPAPLLVNELVVFRSELNNEGSKYTILSRHKLSDKL